MKFFLCVFFLSNFLSVSAALAVNLTNEKYKIRSFQLDLANSISFNNFLTEDQFSLVTSDALVLMLSRVNKIATDSDTAPINLDIYVDYYRRFAGDQTPWPIPALAPPNVIISIKGYKDNNAVIKINTKELTTTTGAFDFLSKSENERQVRDYTHAYQLALTIVSLLSERAKDFSPPRPQELVDFPQKIAGYQEQFDMVSLPSPKPYVPDSAVAPYLDAISNSNIKVRINNFEAIKREWLFNEALINAIKSRLDYLTKATPTKDSVKELRYAMNALAAFGLSEHASIFAEINNTPGFPKEVYKEVEDSNKILDARSSQIVLVHSFSPERDNLPWEIKQLANRLEMSDRKAALDAIVRVKRAYQKEKVLMDVMKDRLEREAGVANYKAAINSSVHAHMCKTLAFSGDPEYLDFLKKMTTTAAIEYTREHCEASWEILADANKKLIKQREKERKEQLKAQKSKKG